MPQEILNKAEVQVLATARHERGDEDTNYFTDADLSILGAAADHYAAYTKAIRKEYSLYPELVYKPGRRKVLEHFLGMQEIFKTAHFREQYESAARKNLLAEVEQLA